MKLKLTLTFALLLVACLTNAATVTGRSAKTSPAGTEKLPIDDAGVDKYITIANLFVGSPAITTPTITTPTITGGTLSGAAITTSSINGNTITTGTGVLTLGAAKTLTVSNSLTLTGTDSSSVAFGSGGTVAYATGALSQFAATTSAQLAGILSNETGSGLAVFATSPTLTTPVLGVATATSLNGLTITSSTGTLTITNAKTLAVSNTLTFTGTDASSVAFGTGGTVAYQGGTLAQFAASTSAQLSGVLSNETGSGVAVFATSPTLVTPVLGVASATTINKVTLTAPATGSTLTIADGKTLTASNTLTFTGTDSTSFAFPATSNTVFVSTLSSNDVSAANSVWGVSNGLVFEGATADGYETTLSPVDPTADQTVSIANAGVANALMFSTLTTNTVGAANSIWGASNSFVFEGATADTSEGTITFADVTADVSYKLPDAAAGTYGVMLSSLATNAPDIADSVYGVTNGLMFEGATADAHEIRFTPADATADVVYLLPDAAAASYSLMSSTLATNAPNIANSVTGSSNALNFEGTADAHEITVTAADATGDVLYQLPDAPAGTYPVKGNVVQARTVTADGTTTGTISAGVTHVTVTSDDANKILILPAPVVGHQICIHGPATGFELRSSTPASIAINAGTGADAESAIPANATLFLTCVSATAWKGFYMDADGDVAKVEAAAP